MQNIQAFFSWPARLALEPEDAYQKRAADRALYLMPRKFEQLEAAVLCFSGLYGLLVALFLMDAAPLHVLICTALLALGFWRYYHPVRTPFVWLCDAVLAVLMMALLFADSRSAGSTGPYLFLALIFAITFPLLMSPQMSIGYSLLLLSVYFLFGRGLPGQAASKLVLLRGVLIAGLCLLTSLFGRVLAQAEEGIESLRRDLQSGAYNPHGLLKYGAPLLRQCAEQGKPSSLALIPMPAHWHEQIAVSFGFINPHPNEMNRLKALALSELAKQLQAALPEQGLVGRNANGEWVVLAANTTREALLARLEQRFGRPLQISFGPESKEMFVMLMPCVVQCEPGEDLIALHARAQDIWSRGVRMGVVG